MSEELKKLIAAYLNGGGSFLKLGELSGVHWQKVRRFYHGEGDLGTKNAQAVAQALGKEIVLK